MTMTSRMLFILLLTFVLSAFVCSTVAMAQSVTNRTVGIAGKMDKADRTPDLGVTVNRFSGRVQILADAHIPHTEYQLYPLQFDFFINRRLFSSQYRSPTLPGPVGVDIASDVAVPPFNYTVVAKVLTPDGRPFTSVLEGAVFNSNLVATLDCTLTTSTDTYTQNSLTLTQVGNNSFSVPLNTTNPTGDTTAQLSGALTVSGEEVSGAQTTTLSGAESSSVKRTMTGSAIFDSNQNLTSFAVNSVDGEVALSCS